MTWFSKLLICLCVIGMLGWMLGVWTFTKAMLAVGLVIVLRILGEAAIVGLGMIMMLNMEVHDLELLKARLYNDIPLLGSWLRRKTVKALAELVQQDNARVADMLAELVIESRDKKVCRIAEQALNQVTSQDCINAIAARWLETRHLGLTTMLVEHQWVASEPLKAYVFTSLKTGQVETLKAGEAQVVEELVNGCDDFDPKIRIRARRLLTQLQRPEARETLCRLVIEQDHPAAMEAALETGCLPRDISRRALFLFLTEQWEAYENLDFDHYLLNTAHRTASPELRWRIADKLRKAGRIDFLTILAGQDYVSRVGDMTAEEIKILIDTLTDGREWQKLWKFVFELPFVTSLDVLKILRKHEWTPQQGDERRIFEELSALADEEMVTSADDAREVLPLALHEAAIRVKGRVNDVAFSPVRPVIAIGTGNRTVGLWNFQQGEMEQIYRDFAHSIGLVTFLPDGILLCAERTNTTIDPCKIYLCRDGKKTVLGEHEGSVTAIDVVNESQLLSTGRDQRLILWDMTPSKKNRRIKEHLLPYWPRTARVSPEGAYVALVYRGVSLFSVPHLEHVVNWTKDSVGRCVAFIPGEGTFVVGKHNGDVQIFDYANYHLPMQRQLLLHHRGRAEGAVMLPDYSVLITAGSEGSLKFTNWPDRSQRGSIDANGTSFTSLHISPDTAFMSTGDSDASMSLWDLRVLDVPHLFTRPFAKATPDHLMTVHELAPHPQLKDNIRRSLTYIQKVLQYRFRFDIEIAEVPTIKVGEFDIEIE